MSLAKDTGFYSIANWGRRFVGLATAPVLIAYFSPAEYGYMSLVQTLASLCSILGLLAIVDQGLPRFFIDTEDEDERRGYVSTAGFASCLGVLFVSCLILGFTPLVVLFIDKIISPIIFTGLIVILCWSQSLYYVGSNMLKWTFRSVLFMKITLIQAILGGGLSIYLVTFFGARARIVLLVMALVGLGAGLVANWSVRGYFQFAGISRQKLKELIAYSWPLLGLNVFAFFARSLDRIFLAALTSLSAVGIFSVSYMIASIFETIISGFFFAWGPYMLSTFRESWAPRKYAQYFSAFSCLGVVSIVGLGLWGGPIVLLFRPEGTYQDIGIYIPWIITGTLLYYLGGYFAPGPAIRKKTYWKLIGFMLAGTCNAGLNYVLIPTYGILGAGVATSLSSLAAGVFNQLVSNRLYYVPNRWKFSFALIIVFTAIVSFVQTKNPIWYISGISVLSRVGLTTALSIAGFLPFYADIRDLGILQRAVQLIERKTT